MSGAWSTSLRDFRSDKSGIAYGTADGPKQANPSSIVAKFEEAAGDGERFTEELPELQLPGHDDRREDCGEDIPRFCSDCGSTSSVGRTCYRSGCPRCWKGWDRRQSTTIASKLEALRRYKEAGGDGWQGWKFHHLALSPPEGFTMDSEEPLQRAFDLLKEVLSELSAATGVLFYHPYRGEDGDDRGFWKNVLPNGEETPWRETREDLSHAPHFHAVVLAKHIPTQHVTGSVERETGWVINRITKSEDSDVSIYDKYDLARVVTYCLSHTGLTESRAAYRYYGEVANFTADDGIEREMDAAVRSVASRTLGLPYDSLTCVIEREKIETKTVERWVEKVNPHAFGGGDGEGSEKMKIEEEQTEVTEGVCQGRLLEITKAPRFLEDADWRDRADNADELAEAWARWRERIDDPPD
jgi:hypothetical protein